MLSYCSYFSVLLAHSLYLIVFLFLLLLLLLLLFLPCLPPTHSHFPALYSSPNFILLSIHTPSSFPPPAPFPELIIDLDIGKGTGSTRNQSLDVRGGQLVQEAGSFDRPD